MNKPNKITAGIRIFWLLLSIFLLSSTITQAQIENKTEPTPSDSAMVCDKMPEFPGGDKQLMKFIVKNTKYPRRATSKGIQGTVICRFVINTTGYVEDIVVMQSIDSELDTEAIRVLKSMPQWEPGMLKGQPVPVYYTMPIRFRLPSSKRFNSVNARDRKKQPILVDQLPLFPGGQAGLRKFMEENIQYPSDAHEKKIQGSVICSFIVNSKGELEEISVLKSVHPSLDEEALRIIKAMPQWIPATQKGKSIDVYSTMPIRFTIEGDIPLEIE